MENKYDKFYKENYQNKEYKDNGNSFIKILLIIIIIILLYTNGIFYKLKIINESNIQEIYLTEKLTENEKIKITQELFKNSEEVMGKPIWLVLMKK